MTCHKKIVFYGKIWYNAPRSRMRYTTMISNIDPRHQKPPAALTNNYFPAMNLFLSFFHEKAVTCTYKSVQNEPNLNNSIFVLTSFIPAGYLHPDTWYRGKNEPKTNPNEANLKSFQRIKILSINKRLLNISELYFSDFFWFGIFCTW